jgi:uncharacterized membrane protein
MRSIYISNKEATESRVHSGKVCVIISKVWKSPPWLAYPLRNKFVVIAINSFHHYLLSLLITNIINSFHHYLLSLLITNTINSFHHYLLSLLITNTINSFHHYLLSLLITNTINSFHHYLLSLLITNTINVELNCIQLWFNLLSSPDVPVNHSSDLQVRD